MTFDNPLLNERNQTHGDFVVNAEISQQIKSLFAHFGYSALSPVHREALDMIALKLSRIISGNPNEPDHWLDIAGYSDLARSHCETPAYTKKNRVKSAAAEAASE